MTRRMFVTGLGIIGSFLGISSPESDRIRFDLSIDEAQALINILGKIAGDSRKSQRKYADQITARLHYDGFVGQHYDVTIPPSRLYVHDHDHMFCNDTCYTPHYDGIFFRNEDEMHPDVRPAGRDYAFMARWRKAFMPDGSLR